MRLLIVGKEQAVYRVQQMLGMGTFWRCRFLYLVRKATSCWDRWIGLVRPAIAGPMAGEHYPEARPLR